MVSTTPKRVGRPRTFEEEQAIDKAMLVFWQKGFEAASLNDLTAAMGMQPASLYKAFGNKQSLFERALARYLAGPVAFMRAALDQPTAYEVAEQILRDSAAFLTQKQARSGCMTIQGALAVGAEGMPIRKKLITLRVKSQTALRKRFERAKREGDLAVDVDAADLARFITAVFQGMTVQAINGATRNEMHRLADMALRAWPHSPQANDSRRRGSKM